MSELSWRDKITGRKIVYPWPVEDQAFELENLSKQTEAGPLWLWAATFPDASLASTVIFPGGARFLRVSPTTNWALEERREGEPHPAIVGELDSAWSTIVSFLAENVKVLRESGSFAALEARDA